MADLKVVPIVQDCAANNPAKGLRVLADAIDLGDVSCEALTVADGAGNVWHFDRKNTQDFQAIQRAVWNLNNGIFSLQSIDKQAN